MTNEEIARRLTAIEGWAMQYLRDRPELTYREFWAAYQNLDPEMHAAVRAKPYAEHDPDVQAAMDSLADALEPITMFAGKPDMSFRSS